MNSNIRVTFAVTLALLAAPALAGTDPVEPAPSPPIVITPTIVDTQAVVALISTMAGTSPEVQQALAELADAPPGSVAAMTAVDSLAGGVATAFITDAASLPVLTSAEATQAIRLIDGLIAALTEAGVSTSGLEALKAAIQNRSGQAG